MLRTTRCEEGALTINYCGNEIQNTPTLLMWRSAPSGLVDRHTCSQPPAREAREAELEPSSSGPAHRSIKAIPTMPRTVITSSQGVSVCPRQSCEKSHCDRDRRQYKRFVPPHRRPCVRPRKPANIITQRRRCKEGYQPGSNVRPSFALDADRQRAPTLSAS